MTNDRRLMSPKETKALGEELTPKFLFALDLDALDRPRSVSQLWSFLQKKSFFITRAASRSALACGLPALSIYGEHERACHAARVLGEIPPNVGDYDYYEHTIHAVYYLALHGGRGDLAASLEPFLHIKGRPLHPNFLAGITLRKPLDDEQVEEKVLWTAMGYVDEVTTMASMCVGGGSPQWPRDRLDAEIQRYLSALDHLPGFELPRS